MLKNTHDILQALRRKRKVFIWQLNALRFALCMMLLNILTWTFFFEHDGALFVSNCLLSVAIFSLLWEIRTWR